MYHAILDTNTISKPCTKWYIRVRMSTTAHVWREVIRVKLLGIGVKMWTRMQKQWTNSQCWTLSIKIRTSRNDFQNKYYLKLPAGHKYFPIFISSSKLLQKSGIGGNNRNVSLITLSRYSICCKSSYVGCLFSSPEENINCNSS